MSSSLHVQVQRVGERGEPLPLPTYRTTGAAGMDLHADALVRIEPGQRAVVPTGLSVAIPPGYEGQVRPRSGLALLWGITCLNSPGTIDSDYRGEIGVLLVNHGDAAVELARGERIAQLVFAKVEQAALEEVATLPESERGSGGFGSTGR